MSSKAIPTTDINSRTRRRTHPPVNERAKNTGEQNHQREAVGDADPEAVDRKLGKKPGTVSDVSAPLKTEDPFAEIWPVLLEKPELGSFGTWDISYGPRKIGEKNRPVNCWTLALPDPGTATKSDLSRWFRAMSNALWPAQKSGSAQTVIEAPHAEIQAEIPQETPRVSMPLLATEDEFEVMARERANLRLPENTTEEAEVEALAIKGPVAVYQWIYGEDSITARKVTGRTWAEWGVE